LHFFIYLLLEFELAEMFIEKKGMKNVVNKHTYIPDAERISG
jgi:hypothetical protein